MSGYEQQGFLFQLKTLADEQRLKMFKLMNGSERTVSEIAVLLKLSAPTISHHLSKLHTAGLLHLRMAGNQRFYRVNEDGLAKFKAKVADIEKPVEETQDDWIEALTWDEADKKVLREYTRNGMIIQFPTKDKKWIVLLRWLATKFQPGIRYTEKEVNAILLEYHADYASLRRSLVDYGFMRRERGGGDYWLTPDNETVLSSES